jgi:hypothetical protein
MANNTTTNGMFDTSNMWALDEALQAEIIDLNSPQVIPFFEKQVVKDEGVRTYERSQAVQDDINAEIFQKLFFNALNEDMERSGLFTKQAETNKTQAEANLILATAQTSKDVVKDLEKESVKKDPGGRRKSVKIENLRGEKPGWEMAKDSNFWSVNEKDPYWQTKAGFKEAMDLYGTKPNWVKEPSLEYNPKTGEYDPIAKEEFAEIKPTKRISL